MTEDETIPPQRGGNGEPESPFELSPPDWKESLRRAIREFKADRGALVSAGMGFYWFLAIFPALLAAVGFIGLVNASAEFIESISKAISSTLPGDAARVLNEALDRAARESGGSSVAAALVGTGLALWSASAGMVALQTGLDVVYDVPEERPFLKKRMRAFALIVVTALLGGVATALIVFGQPLGDALSENLPFGGGAFTVLWTVGRWVLGFAALSSLFAAYYYLGPNRGSPRWAWLSPGGVVATAIWLAASLAFSFYVSSVGNYAETYGSFTGVVLLLLWLYLSAIAVVLGGEINAELERQGEHRRRAGRPGAGTAAAAQQPAPAAPSAPAGDGRPREAASYEADWLESMRRIRQREE